MDDGYRLPLTSWRPDEAPAAVVLGLHGFNDYRNAFAAAGKFFAGNRVLLIAYDQRGFGETAQRGIWPGSERLVRDALAIGELICAQYPRQPVYLLGVSMGGAVAMQALQAGGCFSGVILVAPAVWGWQSMPWWQRTLLKGMTHITPGLKLTAKGLDITPSDNEDMLHALGRDPLVIKETRVDAIYGLTDLMDSAFRQDPCLGRPALLLYGEKDEIIPPAPTCKLLACRDTACKARMRTVLYPNGYHMLLRDLQAEVVYRDILAWLGDPAAELPSGMAGAAGARRIRALCQQSALAGRVSRAD